MNLSDPAITSAVQALATHALPAFAITLLLVLAGVAALWWLLQRYGVHREASRFPPLVYLVGHLLLGFVLIALGAEVFAEIAENIGDGRKLGQLDVLFSDTIRNTVSTSTLQAFALLTHLGDPITLTVLTFVVSAFLLLRRQFWLAAAWILTVAGSGVLNKLLKSIFERARPIHEHGLAFADGWSFPSGHSSGSVVAFGMLAYLLTRFLPANRAALRLPVLLAAAALAFTVGSSRVFLQVHFASDVLAGFASGAAWLAVCVGAVEVGRYRRGRKG
ncbi:MAG: phosphatase PAP2 family protein [Pseudomonadota bacterium]